MMTMMKNPVGQRVPNFRSFKITVCPKLTEMYNFAPRSHSTQCVLYVCKIPICKYVIFIIYYFF